MSLISVIKDEELALRIMKYFCEEARANGKIEKK